MSGTSIKDAAQLVNLPLKVLFRLKQDGVIGDPVSDANLRGLAMIRHIWGQGWYVRAMIAPLSQKTRRKILLEPDMSRAERYALTCYLNAKEGERIRSRDIIGKIEHYLNVRLTTQQVEKVREIAYDIRRGRRIDPRKKEAECLDITEK